MADDKSMVGDVYYPAPEVITSAHIPNYEEVNNAATANLRSFWRKIASDFEWYQPWATVLDDRNAPFYQWFEGAKVNLIHNALDRHMRTAVRNKAAIIFEGEPGDTSVYTYRQLNHEVCKFANVLRSMGVAKGDPVTIFMGRIPEMIIAMLASAKIGAIHSVVHSGSSAGELAKRLENSRSKMLITCDGAWSRGNIVELKNTANIAAMESESVQSVICVKRTGQSIEMVPGRDYWYHELMALAIASPNAATEVMDAEDPLFLLFPQDATDGLKAVMHTHGGYMVGTATTLKWVFDIKPEDVWWCTTELAEITGHSYAVYSPLILGATSFIYEGVPTYPYPDRWWQMVAKYSVTIMYSTPSDIGNLMRFGTNWPRQHDLSSLRLLGTAGEPIDPEVWQWFYRVIGSEKCPVLHTWSQAESGSFVITPLPSMPLKPGSSGRPFPGVQVDVVDADGNSLPADQDGFLVIKTPWPAMLRAIYQDTDYFVDRYWDQFKEEGWYSTGYRARKDVDEYIWISGRAEE